MSTQAWHLGTPSELEDVDAGFDERDEEAVRLACANANQHDHHGDVPQSGDLTPPPAPAPDLRVVSPGDGTPRPVGVESPRGATPEFGVYLPQLKMPYGLIEEKVRVAESLGYHSAWFMDHLAAPAAPDADTLEPLVLGGGLAARTSQIRLGFLCLNAALRHPALLAKSIATMDVMSGGRVELGLGWGSVPEEMRAFGYPAEPRIERVRRLVEEIEILRLMFSGERFSYEGTVHALHNAIGRPVPAQGSIPIHVGGADRRLTLPLARKYADWWNCPAYAADRLGELRPQVGSTKVSVQRVVGLASSRSQRDEVVAEAERRFGSWGGLVCGTAPEVAEQLAVDASLGVDLFVIQFADFATPRTLKLFAREVVPVVRQATGARPATG